ncbi:MAG: AAA family ATPase [Syntrophorhabdaceae bacterium]|nr:AAA family ATPase [Syntrophorhabdaceae bacterium]
MGKIIAVASGKGGTGKTTTVAAVSSCLAALGYSTLAVDYDAGMKNLDLALCMADFTAADYFDVIKGRLSLAEACHEHPQINNLFFLAAPTLYGPEEAGVAEVRQMLEEIRVKFD